MSTESVALAAAPTLDERLLLTLIAVGCFIGVGQLLVSKDPITWKVGAGRAMMTVALAVSAGAVLALVPAASPLSVVGIAAGIASLGTTALERLFSKYAGPKE